MWNGIKNKIILLKKNLGHYVWDLAFIEYNEDIFYKTKRLNKYQKVKNPYKSKWFADPFILTADARKIDLLVEEYDSNIGRGRIAKISISRENWEIKECKIILDLPTHLSFPIIYWYDNKIFVHPENSASGKSKLYVYDEMLEELKEYSTVIDQPLTDAVFYENLGERYVLSTLASNPNGNELSVYKIKEDNSCVLYYTINVPNNGARMAGYIINTKEAKIRPSQNCKGGYGREVIFQRVTECSGRIILENIGKIMPPYGKYEGIHTYNSYNEELAVVDLKRYDYPIIHKFSNCIKRIIFYR